MLLKYKGRVPYKDVFLVKRVKGPGLSNEYHYLVDYDLALVLLQHELEKMEINAYVSQKRNEISVPMNNLMEYLKQFSKYGLRPDQSIDPIKKYGETKDELNALINKELEKHWKDHKVQSGLNNTDKIKMTKKDLKIALEKGAEMCKKFVEEKILTKLTPAEQNDFWKSMNVIPNSWNDLAVYIYSKVFNRNITIPIEDTDKKGFHIEIKSNSTKCFINKMFNEDLDTELEITTKSGIIYNMPKVNDQIMTPRKLFNSKVTEMFILDQVMVEKYQKDLERKAKKQKDNRVDVVDV